MCQKVPQKKKINLQLQAYSVSSMIFYDRLENPLKPHKKLMHFSEKYLQGKRQQVLFHTAKLMQEREGTSSTSTHQFPGATLDNKTLH